jgi:exodeoxyribonuclease X
VPAGPERGKSWDRLAAEALRALTQDRDPNIRFSAETELRRRGDAPEPPAIEPAQRTLL